MGRFILRREAPGRDASGALFMHQSNLLYCLVAT